MSNNPAAMPLKGKVVSFHSSRGGTGKTIIATNLAALCAKKGLNVALLDMDFRAPSLRTVFSKAIKHPSGFWLNDYMDGQCTVSQVVVDVSTAYGLDGRLLVGMANPSPEAVRGWAEKSRDWEVSAVKRLFSMRAVLFDEMNIDCCFFDTTPGIQHSSINAIAASDITVVVATLDMIDLEGVENMLQQFYDVFEKRSAIVVNKVFPELRTLSDQKQSELVERLEER
jgi:MinD-like ATPase involved in chromosome partitioning or flagellar assembly